MQKKIILLIGVLFLTVSTFAQSPEMMSYQAVIRNSADVVLSNEVVHMKISILQSSADGAMLYEETQTTNTNINGLVSVKIGSVNSDSFSSIDWSKDIAYYIKVETDIDDDLSYDISTVSQLLSVPYALYAKTSGSSTPGPQGADGVKGDTGVQGVTGAAGPTGDQGIQGTNGETGAAGTDGNHGNDGATGAAGADGVKGDAGVDGNHGNDGAAGADGVKGDAGADGNHGNDGATGAAGADGNDGENGAQGIQGATGATGADGNDGENGAQGIQGATGAAGADGNDGAGGITAQQASDITSNNEKTGITTAQSDAILANTAKTGITSDQATAIADNTAKVGYTEAAVSANAAVAANTLREGMPVGTATGQMNYWNGTTWQTINPGNAGSVLQLVGTTPTWVSNPDIDAPVITLFGDTTVTIELGATYTDSGATATDESGEITVTTSGTVDTSVVGVYTITYTATDESGNTATTATRTVNVLDTTAPVITITGDATITIELGATYTDSGATATDESGEITVTTSGTVDTSVVGVYTITYTATDESGNAATTATRTVNVLDTIAPVITITGDATITIELGATYTDSGATATDNYDSEINVSVIGAVDTSVVGVYTITYTATDESGNTATEVTRTVNVVDTTAPAFVSVAATDGTYIVGNNIDITVTYDEDVMIGVTGKPTLTLSNGANALYTSGSGTTALVFRYTVGGCNCLVVFLQGDADSADLSVSSYTGVITDGAGNTAGAASGNLGAVIVDANAPVITFTSGIDTVEQGSTWTDAGATADGGETVTASGSVDTSTIGTYTITYTATDAAGNTGKATRMVTVQDTTAPVITLLGNANLSHALGTTFIDPGAVATDIEYGDLTLSITTSGTVDINTIGGYTIIYNVSDAAGNPAVAVLRTVTVSPSARFDYTGSEQTFEVPVGVTSISVEAHGGQGGTKTGAGYGAKVSATLAVTPGDVLYINVAGKSTGLSGGYNGGGIGQVGTNNGNTTPGIGGGGASHIALSSGLLASFSGNQSAVLVAAGGGGGGMGNINYTNLNTHPNDAGYGHGGKTGQNGLRTFSKRNYGTAGTQSSGGTTNEGQSGWGGEPNGSFGQGGYIGPVTYGFGYSWEPSNGGGGGWYGGGGGAWGCGGGGGSSNAHPTSATNVVYTTGFNAGAGKVIITY